MGAKLEATFTCNLPVSRDGCLCAFAKYLLELALMAIGVSFFARFGCFFGFLPDLPDLLDADDVDELLLLLRRLYILSSESALSLSLPLLLLLMSRIAASRARRLRA